MRLLPYRRITLRSPLSASAVVQLLENSVEPKRRFRFGSGARRFEGTVTGLVFDIQPILFYRNSFVPQIRGTIEPEPTGSRISLVMRPHLAVLVFMSAWLSSIFAGGVTFAIAAFRGCAGIGPTLIPFAMFLFGWMLTVGGFSSEATRAEQYLISMVRGIREPSV
jgi:hypothetical protein